jgi:hypothetical protein
LDKLADSALLDKPIIREASLASRGPWHLGLFMTSETFDEDIVRVMEVVPCQAGLLEV